MRASGFLLLAGAAACATAAHGQAAPVQTPAPDPAPVADAAPPPPALGDTPAAPVDQPQTAPAVEPVTEAAEPGADEDEETAPDIIVTGSRAQRGAVVGDIAPEQQLSPADIRSYGVSSVADLLTELSPQTRSGRGSGGAPVVLLNGRRISGFAEIRDLPTEAIQRVDILPEEVALKYGYRADQRVVNFVLRRRFRAVTVELDDRVATEGGRQQPEGELDLLRITGTGRASLHLEYSQADALSEAERDIVQGSGSAAVGGNLSSVGGGDLAPGLGDTVPVPAIAGTRAPQLTDFAAGVNVTDQSRLRTLLPETRTLQGNAVYATTLFGNVSAALNGRIEHNRTESDRGLADATLALPATNPFNPFGQPVTLTRAFDSLGALQQRNSSTEAHLGASLNGDAGQWRWSVTANVDRNESDTRTQTGVDVSDLQDALTASAATANPFAAFPLTRLPDNQGRSTSTQAEFDTLASGPAFRLPAGQANVSLRIGASTSDFSSRSVRLGEASGADVARDSANAQANLDLPIASRREGVLSALGNLSLNGNVAVEHLSDFGSLWTLGYGANWSPIEGVRLLASVTDEDRAPSAAQLGNPQVVTPGVRVFDYVNGTTATVTTITGGNPGLSADNRHVLKLGLDVRPWSARDISFSANYVSSRTDDPISAFPSATAAIEEAFPTRFFRENGTLLRIDSRPINYARAERSELRYGVNLSFPVKSQVQRQLEAFRAGTGPNPFAGLRPPGRARRNPAQPDGSAAAGTQPGPGPAGNQASDGSAPAGGADASPRPRRFGGFGGRGGRGQGGGRVQFALYHTWHLTDRVLVADNGPLLDLLNGDAIGSSGGQPRHELEGQAGYSNNGLGARLSVTFRSATEVQGGTAAAPETLNFGSLATANLRLFADLGQRLDLVRRHPWLRGTRVTASVDNIFNTRQRVTDATGTVPIGFQPGYLDPLGRTVRVSVRKLFF